MPPSFTVFLQCETFLLCMLSWEMGKQQLILEFLAVPVHVPIYLHSCLHLTVLVQFSVIPASLGSCTESGIRELQVLYRTQLSSCFCGEYSAVTLHLGVCCFSTRLS